MKIIFYFLIGILTLSCVNKSSSKKPDLAINSERKVIEIEYLESREKTINNLKTIWNCKRPLISKSETNFNGEISNDITVMITGIESIDSEDKKKKIKLTYELIKKSVVNYKDFLELKIITSYTTSDGERNTSSKTIKMIEL